MKPKLFILLALLTAYSFTTKAQNLTFEQTVDWLKNFQKANTMYIYFGSKTSNTAHGYISDISVENSGRILIKHMEGGIYGFRSFNVYDIESSQWAVSNDEYDLKLLAKNNTILATVSNLNKPDGDRLYKALLHFKKVCTKSADPFGN